MIRAVARGLRIHHLAVRASDPETVAAFYSGVLGLPELRRSEDATGLRAVWVQAGDMVLMIERSLKGEGPAAGSGHVFVFAVEDLTAWERRLEAAGVAVDDRTEATLYVRDPEGHRVGLSVYPMTGHLRAD